MIEQLGKELLEPNEDGLEQVEGHRVVELLATTPTASAEEPGSTGSQDSDQRYSVSLQVGQLKLCCKALACLIQCPTAPVLRSLPNTPETPGADFLGFRQCPCDSAAPVFLKLSISQSAAWGAQLLMYISMCCTGATVGRSCLCSRQRPCRRC